ncbi:MAG TPA: hypothetical protein VFJ74_04575 [Gemmatimonadaceae bacterium]|nr:hypothetical protein [Gemmatimonadaceae bacterium]
MTAGATSPTTPTTPPSRRARIVVALLLGALAGGYAWLVAATHPGAVSDFDTTWYASRALARGADPYALIGPGRAFDFPFPYSYPLTAGLVALPLAWLPVVAARVAFVTLSSALLAFAVTRDGWGRLPLFGSAAFVMSVVLGQWAPLLVAASLLPAVGWAVAAKPNLGLALVAGASSRRRLLAMLAGGVAVTAVTLALRPSWPLEWADAVRRSTHFSAPVARPGGVLLLLALLRWRRPEARLLLALACVPQTPSAPDALLLFVVAGPGVETLLLALLTYATQLAGRAVDQSADLLGWMRWYAQLVVPLLYLPCLVMVLRRPNEGPAPAWLERRLPALLRRWPRRRAAG